MVDDSDSRSRSGGAGSLRGRGRTTIADKVLERLATRAALDVPGVLRHSAGAQFLSAVSASWPRATATSAGERVSVRVALAVDWGQPVREVAAQVRRRVRDRLADETGKSVDRVDVTVAAVVPPSRQDTGHERRVQ